MGPPTVTQRLEQLEATAAESEATMADLVAKAVETAVTSMKQALTEILLEGQAMAAKKQGDELEALSMRLEGRINRAREQQEHMLNMLRSDQLKFYAELKALDSGLKASRGELGGKGEGEDTPLMSTVGHLASRSGQIPIGAEGGSTMGPVGGKGSGGGPGNWRYRKLDMPIFDGTDPDGWILRVERYFTFYRLNEEEMLEAVAVALEGDALRWYQWEQKRRPIRLWADLKTFLLRQFRPTEGGSLYEQWLATSQTSTVGEYKRRFIETAAPLERISEQILLGQFLNGLKEEVRVEVRLLNPVNLEQAMELAVRVEEKQKALSTRKQSLSTIKTISPRTYSKGSQFGSVYSQLPPTSPTTHKSWGSTPSESQASVYSPKSTSNSNVTKVPTEFRRLTEKELQEKKSKGICFRCDDKWTMGHRCRRKELSVILIDDEEDGTDEGSTEPPLSPTEELTTEVSLNSVVGLSNPKTMKIRGTIDGAEVIVMIDPGATHNFVALSVVQRLGLTVEDSGGFGVSLGNGETIKGRGICRGVNLALEGKLMLCEDFLPLELGTSDVILGVQWLETLGPVTTN